MHLFSKKPQPKLSLLIPFSTTDPERKKSFEWLLNYWKYELPAAEIIIGKSKSDIFCKGEALNDAVSRSTGKVFAILDADAYLDGQVLDYCADRILEELDNGLWYVPYRRLYRLTQGISESIRKSDPRNPLRLPPVVPQRFIENTGNSIKYGNRFGAMLMMFPRQAYETIGRFDERFKGWGGEDIALLRTLDTVWGKHKTTDNSIMHLWHPFYGSTYKDRRWAGQDKGEANAWLNIKYYRAFRNPSLMRELLKEYQQIW